MADDIEKLLETKALYKEGKLQKNKNKKKPNKKNKPRFKKIEEKKKKNPKTKKFQRNKIILTFLALAKPKQTNKKENPKNFLVLGFFSPP